MKNLFLLTTFSIMICSALQAQQEQNIISVKGQYRSQQRGLRRIGPVVEYNLDVKDTTVNFTGKRRKAIAINGQIPAPTLRFTEGDSAVIHVHNLLREEVSIHWHGVLLPNQEDGVPVLNTPPIRPGQTHTFRFRIIQSGTLWYHSHTMFQEQEGLYGPLIFYPAYPERKSYKNEEVLQISDWRDERGSSVMRSLKRRTEWYAIQKKSVQSWGEAIVKGHFGDKVQMEWTRMPGADVSDVYYQKHLMQGQPVRTFEKYRKGDSILLRVINGSSGTYYWLQYSGGKMKVVAADGNNVHPVDVDKVLIATAETYDIIIKIPDNGQYEFRATAQDITGSASAFFGSGPQVKAKNIPKLDYITLMSDMNRMTWMMKGEGMKMKMGLYMKMPEKSMNMQGMQEMDQMNMENMDKFDSSSVPIDHNKLDTSMKMNMNNMPQKDTAQHKMKDMDMKGMNKPTRKKPVTTAKKPVKKTTTTKKKASKKKPAPKKKKPMKGMNMESMPNMKMKMGFAPHSYIPQLATSLYSGAFAINFSNSIIDTVPSSSTHQNMNVSNSKMHNMDTMKIDTVPGGKNFRHPENSMGNMQGRDTDNMNMSGMIADDKQKKTINQKDTSRSYMLQTMMKPMPMTGFDFPPGNGNDVVLSYNMLRSDSSATALQKNRPWRELEITLSGNMQRFVWSINGKTLSQQDTKFMIRKGENVRIIFTNATMMEHPMHLHGHFFRLINNQGAYAPMKHTFNINAMHTQVIEFAATEEKDWFLHCHTLYHMIGGMATILSYEGTESEVQKTYPKEFRKFKREHGSLLFPWSNASFHNQGTFGTVILSGRNFQFDGDWRWNYKKSYDLEPTLQYFLDKRQFFSAFLGAEFSKNNFRNGKEQPIMDQEKIATAGLIYMFPFFINAEGRVDSKGRLRFQIRREDLPLTTRTRMDFYWNTDDEYGVTARYIIAKYLAVSANYDHQYGWGAGLSIIY